MMTSFNDIYGPVRLNASVKYHEGKDWADTVSELQDRATAAGLTVTHIDYDIVETWSGPERVLITIEAERPTRWTELDETFMRDLTQRN